MKNRLFLSVFILLVSCDSNNEKSLAIHENKKDVADNTVVGGVPAKIIKRIN